MFRLPNSLGPLGLVRDDRKSRQGRRRLVILERWFTLFITLDFGLGGDGDLLASNTGAAERRTLLDKGGGESPLVMLPFLGGAREYREVFFRSRGGDGSLTGVGVPNGLS